MKNKIKLFEVIALIAIIIFSMAACNKSGSSSGSSAPAASSSSADVDKLLADYESFVNDYVSLMQKFTDGDTSVAADAQKLGAEVAEWSAKWEGLTESDFTPAQTLKMQELNAKVAAALNF
jgi:hypothetical protein